MTLKLLQETRIGMSVNGIRKHYTDDVVVSLSKILIKDWKRLLGRIVGDCLLERGAVWSCLQSTANRSPFAENTPIKEMPKIPTTPTSPMSPSFSSAGVPLSPCLATGENIRDKCIEMLAAALRTDGGEKTTTDMKYKNRVRSRISNLKDPKKPGLRRNVLAGGIELRRFTIMSAEEMASDKLKQLRNNLTKEAVREHQVSKTSGTISDLFQCSKCSKNNCTYNQTSSADEPMTTFVLCNECGNRWKFC
uniref:Transcription elongation factor A (SII), 3 n=1 Tax=Oncorhynchus kisutch TaxID=8019 RepID=A0A8C7CE33_ONCKI